MLYFATASTCIAATATVTETRISGKVGRGGLTDEVRARAADSGEGRTNGTSIQTDA